MKRVTKILTLSAAALALGACSSPYLGSQLDRSRNLNNPAVSANTMANQVCSVCHGDVGSNVNGNSVNPSFPILAGQQADYLEGELKELRSQSRSDPAAQQFMWAITRNLTDAQIKGLATYFAHQKAMPNPAASDPALVSEGQKIFNEGFLDKGVAPCMACHGANAEGNGPIPRLAGQHADYLYKQLVVFSYDATRGEKKDVDDPIERPLGEAMEGIAHGLNDHQMHAVAEYLQSIK
jgi:cytochrome c553